MRPFLPVTDKFQIGYWIDNLMYLSYELCQTTSQLSYHIHTILEIALTGNELFVLSFHLVDFESISYLIFAEPYGILNKKKDHPFISTPDLLKFGKENFVDS